MCNGHRCVVVKQKNFLNIQSKKDSLFRYQVGGETPKTRDTKSTEASSNTIQKTVDTFTTSSCRIRTSGRIITSKEALRGGRSMGNNTLWKTM